MDSQILALVISEGSKVIGEMIRHRAVLFPAQKAEAPSVTELPITEEKAVNYSVGSTEATAVATGCVPCSLGHLGTCSGLLNEAVRFARKGGIENNEIFDRINMCLDELNALERVDLRPELIVNLPEWEKNLANQVLLASRAIRHNLEDISSVSKLEQVAATTQSTRNDVGRQWFKQRLELMSPQEKVQVQEGLTQRIKDYHTEHPTEQGRTDETEGTIEGQSDNPAKLDRCVANVQAKIDAGELPEGSNAWAICKAALKE